MTLIVQRSILLATCLAAFCLGVSGSRSVLAADENAPKVGHKIENFSLHDSRGAMRSLADWADKKWVVVAFLGNECPLAKAYAPRLEELAQRWQLQGVAFVGINSNQQDSMTEVTAFVQEMKLSIPVLKDPGNKVADNFAALRTPEVFVLDADRVVRYHGRIDDQYGIGLQRSKADHNDLDLALTELTAGKQLTQATTPILGCLIGRVHRPQPGGDVTYSNQIARLLQNRCVECHHTGQIAPFGLTKYEEVVGWAEMMREVIHERRMPPWSASPAHGSFRNNPSLSDGEIALVDRWVANGCPEGDAKDLPVAMNFPEGWGIPQPDQIFYMSDKSYQVPATGVVRYQHFTVDPGFTEDRWIKAAEIKPSNPQVVHHVIVYIQPKGVTGIGTTSVGDPQIGFAPGTPPRRLDDGAAIRIPAGAKLLFQVHYTPNGTAQEDRTCVGFVYAKPEDVTQEVIGGNCGNAGLRIPAHTANHIITAQKVFNKDTVLLGMNPHMHLRGKSFRYEVQYPDGNKEVLLDVPHYDFNWQLWYMLSEPKTLPKGTRMICTASYDNTENNLANPDPSKDVRFGEQTWDEMMFGFFSVIEPVKPAVSGGGAGQ